jgi:hypothetical protein
MEDNAKKKTGGRREPTRFWIWAEQWLLGSTRTELKNEERAVLLDFLCLAALKGGYVECYSRDQLASQLCIERELLDKCIEKFIDTCKVKKKVKQKEKKEIFLFTKWEQYQPEYLWKRPYRSMKKGRSVKPQQRDSEVGSISEVKGNEVNGSQKGEDEAPQVDLSKLPFKAQNKIFELRDEIRQQKKTLEQKDKNIPDDVIIANIREIEKEIEEIMKECSWD